MTELRIPSYIKNVNTFSAEYLREILHYDSETGVFTWRIVRPGRGGIKPGTIAGSIQCGKWKPVRVIGVLGKSYRAHRLAWFYMLGVWPELELDHIDTDSLNNSWSNLRMATTQQNQANRGIQKNNKAGFKGVYWHPSKNAWRAATRFNGKKLILGEFKTPELAHEAYHKKVQDLHGEFARL